MVEEMENVFCLGLGGLFHLLRMGIGQGGVGWEVFVGGWVVGGNVGRR